MKEELKNLLSKKIGKDVTICTWAEDFEGVLKKVLVT
jgi:hypothetical protein